MSYQKVIILGRVAKDPEIIMSAAGNKIAKLSIPVDDYARKGEEKTTTWFNVTAFTQRADVIDNYVRKGDMIYVECEFHVQTFRGRDGGERQSNEFVVRELKLIGAIQKRDNSAARGDEPRRETRDSPGETEDFDDDIPF